MFQITATCENGHKQVIRYDHSFGRPYVETQAGLLDGTWGGYQSKPVDDPNSEIGKCGICRSEGKGHVPFKCEVTEIEG